ncbi:MAG: hypothetical protein Q7J85_01480 [Bacillota bacterium]|nr:hypothetical protein [Bacillota bacterium]
MRHDKLGAVFFEEDMDNWIVGPRSNENHLSLPSRTTMTALPFTPLEERRSVPGDRATG